MCVCAAVRGECARVCVLQAGECVCLLQVRGGACLGSVLQIMETDGVMRQGGRDCVCVLNCRRVYKAW